MIHSPEMLILDEPTSGVDPVARDTLWQLLVDLSRRDLVTILISTHFMNEAERCDRISLMHQGKVLVSDTPQKIIEGRGALTLEDAFIGYLEEAIGEERAPAAVHPEATPAPVSARQPPHARTWRRFDPRRMLSYTQREGLELRRDPIRMTLAVLGSVILLVVIAYGLNLDVDILTFAVLDRDQTTTSQNYQINLAGSRYFIERPPITDYADLDRRMRSGEISLALEIPPRFARDVARGRDVEIAAWIDGAMPTRGETIRGYVQGVHAGWIAEQVRRLPQERSTPGPYELETRFRYNPGFESLVAMAPGFIPVLLMLIPAMLAALSVVREKKLGSIVNLYVTPMTRLEFLLGKQIPYVVLSMASALLLWACASFVLRVPFTGSFPAFALGALIYVGAATGFGLLISSFVRSQVAAVFGTGILTIVAAVNFCGLVNPLSSMEGPGVLVGRVFPTTYFITISRGTFSKALGFEGLASQFVPLLIAVPVLLGVAAALLPKQAR